MSIISSSQGRSEAFVRTVKKIDWWFFFPDVCRNLVSHLVQRFLKAFLDDHAVQVTREQYFLVLWRVRIICAARGGYHTVQLSQHESAGGRQHISRNEESSDEH
jgi:hypothetical protein